MKNVKRNKEATNNEAIADYNLPTLKKHDKTRNAVKDPSEKVELFPSDSESDTAEEVIEKSKPKRGKRGGKNVNKKPAMVVSNDENPESDDDMEDVVEDLKSSDW